MAARRGQGDAMAEGDKDGLAQACNGSDRAEDKTRATENASELGAPSPLDALRRIPGAFFGSFGFAACVAALEAWRWPAIAQGAADAWQVPLASGLGFANPLSVAMLFALALYYRCSRRKALRRNVVAIVVACCMTASLFLFYSQPAEGTEVLPLLAVASKLHIMLGAVLVVIWVETLYRQQGNLVPLLALSLAEFFVIQATTGLLIRSMAQGACALLPILSLLCLAAYRRQLAPPFAEAHRTRTPEEPKDAHPKHQLIGCAVALLAFGLLFVRLHYLWYFQNANVWGTLAIQCVSALGALVACPCVWLLAKGGQGSLVEAAAAMFTLLALYFSGITAQSQLGVFYLTPLNAAQKLVLVFCILESAGRNVRGGMATFCVLYGAFRLGLCIPLDQASAIVGSGVANTVTILVAVLVIAHALCGLVTSERTAGRADEEGAQERAARNGRNGSPEARGADARSVGGRGIDDARDAETAAACTDVDVNDSTGNADGLGQSSADHYRTMAFYYFFGQKHQLTQRETEIIPLLCEMKNAHAVADELLIAQTTAKSHMRNIYQKLGVHAQTELAELVKAERKAFLRE